MSFDQADRGSCNRDEGINGAEKLNKEAKDKWSLLTNIVLENDTQIFQSIMDHVRTANGKVKHAAERKKKNW